MNRKRVLWVNEVASALASSASTKEERVGPLEASEPNQISQVDMTKI